MGSIVLATPSEAVASLACLAAGAALQRLADPASTREGWRRAAPWLAGIAALSLAYADEPRAPSGYVDGHRLSCFELGAHPVLWALGAVPLVQIAAALAGRGRPAPFRRAARGAQVLVFAVALVEAWRSPFWIGITTEEIASGCGVAVLLGGAAAMLRRAPRPGSAAVLALGALASMAGFVVRLVADEDRHWDVFGDLIAQTAGSFALALLAALAIRRSRLDREALDVAGIDAGAPADLFAALWLAAELARRLVWELASSALGWGMALELASLAARGAAIALVFLALRRLRRLLDAAARRPSAAGTPGA